MSIGEYDQNVTPSKWEKSVYRLYRCRCRSVFFIFFTLHKTGVLRNWHASSAYCTYHDEANAKNGTFSTKSKTKTERIDVQLILFIFILCIYRANLVVDGNAPKREMQTMHAERFVASFCAHLRLACTKRNHLFAPNVEDEEVSLVCEAQNRRFLFVLMPLIRWPKESPFLHEIYLSRWRAQIHYYILYFGGKNGGNPHCAQINRNASWALWGINIETAADKPIYGMNTNFAVAFFVKLFDNTFIDILKIEDHL